MTKKADKKGIVLGLDLVGIEEDGYHLFVKGRINGKPARFLVDTGASRTVVDKKRVTFFFKDKKIRLEKMKKLSTGLGTNSMESNTVRLDLFSLGKVIVKGYHAVALDLSHVNQSYKMLGMKEIDGVVGSDLLHKFQACIDYRNKTVTLFR